MRQALCSCHPPRFALRSNDVITLKKATAGVVARNAYCCYATQYLYQIPKLEVAGQTATNLLQILAEAACVQVARSSVTVGGLVYGLISRCCHLDILLRRRSQTFSTFVCVCVCLCLRAPFLVRFKTNPRDNHHFGGSNLKKDRPSCLIPIKMKQASASLPLFFAGWQADSRAARASAAAAQRGVARVCFLVVGAVGVLA